MKEKIVEEHITTIKIKNELCGKACDLCKMWGKGCMPERMAKKLAKKGYRKVVMCKDCKICDFGYFEKKIGEEAIEGYYCRKYREMKLPNDFCSEGIRKGN